MTPADYLRIIVLPTLAELMEAHLRDHLAEALVTPTGVARADRRAVEREAERAALRSPEPFDVVRAVPTTFSVGIAPSLQGCAAGNRHGTEARPDLAG